MNPKKLRDPRLALILLLLFLWYGAPLSAGIFGGCIDDVTGTINPNQVPNNCTANDVTFTLVGLGIQDDGCVGPGDTFSIFLGATVQNTTAQTRYDVGLYVATDGDPNGDGARSGSCYRETLTPIGTTGVTTCPPLDLDGGSGPYLNVDGDSCGDLFSGGAFGCDQTGPGGTPDGTWDDSFIIFTDAITLPCDDATANGFAEIPTGSTWGQQIDDVGGVTCDSAAEVIPGTKAKCKLVTLDSNVPVPNLGLSCSCDRTMVAPTESTTCTVSYTNNRTCTTNPATAERFRCGTASFLRFEADYDQANGATSLESVTRGAVTDDGDVLTWVPASAATLTPGIIGPNGETATLTFDYTVAAGTPQGTNISLTTSAYWSNTSPTDPAAVVQTALTCTLGIQTTPVTLAWVETKREDGSLRVDWATATEVGNVGFRIREATASGAPRPPSRLVPSKVGDSTKPQSYSLEIPDFRGESFYVEDIDIRGTSTLHGPFTVGVTAGRKPEPQAVAWERIRQLATAGEGLEGRFAGARGNPTPTPTSAEILIDSAGLVRVSYEQLAAAGVDLAGVAVKDLALTNRGQPVPTFFGGGHSFGPGAYLEFLGETLDTLYTGTNVYRLTVARGGGSGMGVDRRPAPVKGSSPAAYREVFAGGRKAFYAFSSPTGDPWYDTRMLVFQSAASWSFDLPVSHMVTTQQAAVLTVQAWGVTDFAEAPDHHLRVLINGTLVAEQSSDGLGELPISVALPPGLLVEGNNTLTLELPGDTGALADLINLEGYRLEYSRALSARADGLRFTAAGEKITLRDLPHDSFRVLRLRGGQVERLDKVLFEAEGGGFTATFAGSTEAATYWVAPRDGQVDARIAVRRPAADLDSRPGEYLILSHPLFLNALQPLVEARRAAGLSVKVVNTEDVYDLWGHGIFDPEALQDYIAYAARNLGTHTVLLVGADTYDYRNFLGQGSMSFLPSLYAATGPLVQFAPVDPLFGDVDGDRIPDVAVGRFPVRTVAELELLLAKTFAYEAKSYDRTVVAAADRFDGGNHLSFTQDSERFLASLPADWTPRRAYIDTLGVSGARQSLVQGLDEGVALASYVGHSGPTVWTFSGLFSTAEATALNNVGKPTVILQWGCWNTYYVEPAFDTLGHALLLSGDRGAAAVLGASTLLSSDSTRALAKLLAPLIAQPGMSLGAALTAAKRELAETEPERLDVILGWTLLGDPALVVEP